MKNPPSIEALCDQIYSILDEAVELKEKPRFNAPLMQEVGLDSLDMIEFGFSLEEHFGFEFSDKNAFEMLDEALDGRIIQAGQLTELGREMIHRRAPELDHLTLPDSLGPIELQQYFTIETFARLLREFYLAAPDTCPDSGEEVILDGFKIRTSRGQSVSIASGDELMERWVQDTISTLPGD